MATTESVLLIKPINGGVRSVEDTLLKRFKTQLYYVIVNQSIQSIKHGMKLVTTMNLEDWEVSKVRGHEGTTTDKFLWHKCKDLKFPIMPGLKDKDGEWECTRCKEKPPQEILNVVLLCGIKEHSAWRCLKDDNWDNYTELMKETEEIKYEIR